MNYRKPEIVTVDGINCAVRGGTKWLGLPADGLRGVDIFFTILAYEADE